MAPFWQVRNLSPGYLQVSPKPCLEINVTVTTNEIEEYKATKGNSSSIGGKDGVDDSDAVDDDNGTVVVSLP